MKELIADFRYDNPVKFKIIMVCVFQFYIYLTLMIFPVESMSPSSNIAFFFAIVILFIMPSIILLYWVIRYVDKVRYWLIGVPFIFGLAILYTSPNAMFHVRTTGGGGGSLLVGPLFSPEEGAFVLALFIASIQCTLCIGKWGAIKFFGLSNRDRG